MEFLPDVIPLKQGDYEIKDFKGELLNWECKIKCRLNSEADIDRFVEEYMELTGETLKLKLKKPEKEKGQYILRNFYRCTHNTRYENTREGVKIMSQNPNKRFKNTFCPFQMSCKILKPGIVCDVTDEFQCTVIIEHYRNHPISSLEVLSFRSIDPMVQEQVYRMFEDGMTASQAYYEFIRNMKIKCENELEFHIQKADRSLCPRRRDFNVLYTKHCTQQFGARNGNSMFEKLQENIKLLQEDGMKIKYQLYDQEHQSSLIIAVVSPLMLRVHSKVSENPCINTGCIKKL